MQRPPTLIAFLCLSALVVTGCGGDDKDSKAPTTPSGVTVQAGSATSVHVMWEQASDDKAVTGYEVFQKDAKVKTVPAAKTMVDVNGLKPETAYSFTVRARDAAGNLSKPSAAISVTTPAPTPEDAKAPTRPTGLRGELDGKRAVSLRWRPAADNTAVTSYDIYQEDSRIHSVSGTETSARVTGLRPGTVYTFTIRARDAAENSSPDSNAVDLTTAAAPGEGPNTAPTDLKAAVRKGSVELSWLPPEADGPIESHELYLDGKPATTIVWGAMPTGKRATYTMTVTDPPGTRYSVKLRAKLPDGKWGDFSAQRTVVLR
ncbi:fibronectin type III domain-containing protein [Streptomyces jumonjinensis]|uniref:Fibronectin type III domain-containing protein n=1 Tax=Streptomyces jumonjinensis TaxID=1945 RepID=A0A646KNW9_STRJU|nr:fibronectin type III domain-containing protein [Streptomyces jumonjinensis]MQT02676.1 fibronectin type III domain-containing protein [Streptomyces jumonjinensis]